MPSAFICPLCSQPLLHEPTRWFCDNNHSFDVAKHGYINLLPVNQKKSRMPGDATEMVAARQAFLSAGHYAPLRDTVVKMVQTFQPNTLLDVGCGEGYYTLGLSETAAQVIAVDISKPAVQTTARKASQTHKDNIQSIVASAAQVPVAGDCVDVAVSIFSPIIPHELARIIKPAGKLIIAKPAEQHLMALREQLFDDVIRHDSDKFIAPLTDEHARFTLVEKIPLSFDIQLDHTMLNHLLTMTPYAYKAKPDKRHRVAEQDSLAVTAAFYIYVFERSA